MDDRDMLKFIVEELGKEPFKLEYNVASFGSLKGKLLLKVLNRILGDISPKHNEDITDETPLLVCTQKILELLRVLRYWPKHNDPYSQILEIPIENIREGLEDGAVPEIIWEIMYWLLSRREELKQRGYLAQFLVKIPVPDEIRMDEDVEICYEKYENQIEEFKRVHKSLQEINQQTETRPVGELVNDLGKINHDIECLGRKVEALKNRVRDVPEKEEFLEKAKIIRKARDEKLRLESQMRDEELKLMQATRKAETLFSRFNDIREMNQENTPEGALERSEQDCEVLKYIVDQRLPYKIMETQRAVLAMTITEEQPPECFADLEYNRQKLEEVLKEIRFYESQVRSKELNPTLKFARQQSSTNQKKKLDLSEDMETMKDDLTKVRETLEAKRQQKLGQLVNKDDMPLTTEGFRDYVKGMRVKGAKYKAMRTELHALQAEVGNLSTTKYILEGERKSSEEDLEVVEKKLGIVGFSVANAQERLENLSSEKSAVEQKKMDTIYQMATLAKTLNDQVVERRSELEPLMKDLKAERQALQDMENKKRQLKDVMDMELAPINAIISRLEKHFDQLLHCCELDELQCTQLSAEIPILRANLQRAMDVMEAGDRNLPVPRIRNFRAKLVAKIMESEQTQRSLNLELTDLNGAQEYAYSQQKMWMALRETLKLKLETHQSYPEESIDDFI